MRKRFGAREITAATIIVGVAALYWYGGSNPPVTVAPANGERTPGGQP